MNASSQTTDFFEAGVTYHSSATPYTAPEQTTIFQCVGVAEHPGKPGEFRAFGFDRTGAPGSRWQSCAYDARAWGHGWVVTRELITPTAEVGRLREESQCRKDEIDRLRAELDADEQGEG